MTLQSATDFEASPYLFSSRELARLAVYRAAVTARFYTDQLDQPTIRHSVDALRLLGSATVRREQRAA